MSSKILIHLAITLLLPFFSMGFSNSIEDSRTIEISNNCLSFVFVPSDYNGQTISCHNGADGVLTVSAFGGTPPYSYLWEDNSTNFQRTNLNAGTYSVTVSDANGCNLNSSISLDDPDEISITQNISFPVSCINSTDGILSALATGGTQPYSFEWSNGNTDSFADNLSCGSYQLTVTDANGCTRNAIFSLSCPIVMQVDVAATSDHGGFNVSCPEAADGAAAVVVQFGAPPYQYAWSSGSTDANPTNLTAGINTVSVTDFKGCEVVAFVDMTAPVAMELVPNILSDFEGADVSCENATDGNVLLGVVNGTAPYTFLWGNGETTQEAIALPAGSTGVTVTDTIGCVVESFVDLTGYQIAITPQVISDYNGSAISCNGASDGTIKMDVVAGASSPPNVTYAWSNGHDNELLEGIPAGTYTLTVTSPTGCTAYSELTIDNPDAVEAIALATSDYNGFNISIKGMNNGEAVVTPSGGIAPYNILWDNGETNLENENLYAGTQSVSITDANGCQIQASVELTEPTELEGFADVLSDYNGQDISCIGNDDGQAIAIASGAVPPYTFNWSNATSGDSTSNLGAGTHIVTITDANGATLTTMISLFDPQPIELQMQSTSSTNPPSGTATAVVTGGTAPFQFSWDDELSRTSEMIDQVSPGWYRVTVTDANGCEEVESIEVKQSHEIYCIQENMTITPNGDGRNDYFALNCIHPFNNTVEIYDRWGNLVFNTFDYDGTWNAMKNNKEIPDGGYFYIISVALPTGKRTFKGSLTVIR